MREGWQVGLVGGSDLSPFALVLHSLAGLSLDPGGTLMGSIPGNSLGWRRVGGLVTVGHGRVACWRQVGGPTVGAVGMFPDKGLGLRATAMTVGPRWGIVPLLACSSGDQARVGSVGTTWGWSSRTGVRKRARDWCTRCPGSCRTAMPDGRSHVGRVVAGIARSQRRGTAYSRMSVCVPRGTAERLGSTRLGLRPATARVAGGTRVTAGGSPAIRAQRASGQQVAGLRADKYRTVCRCQWHHVCWCTCLSC